MLDDVRCLSFLWESLSEASESLACSEFCFRMPTNFCFRVLILLTLLSFLNTARKNTLRRRGGEQLAVKTHDVAKIRTRKIEPSLLEFAPNDMREEKQLIKSSLLFNFQPLSQAQISSPQRDKPSRLRQLSSP